MRLTCNHVSDGQLFHPQNLHDDKYATASARRIGLFDDEVSSNHSADNCRDDQLDRDDDNQQKFDVPKRVKSSSD